MIRRTELMRVPHDNPPEWILVLTAYIDESGFGDRDVVVVGGFFGNDDEWSLCADRWTAALGKRRSLHMKSLRWNKPERIKLLLEKLGPVPHSCGLIPVWARLRVSDYADLLEDTTVSRKLQQGYFLGAQYLGLILLQYVRMFNERIKIVFEHNGQFSAILPITIELYGSAFSVLTSSGQPCLSGVEMIPKDSSCLTEPADYLAYARLQQLRDPNSVRARLCAPIMDPQPGVYVDVERDDIRKLMSSRSQQHIRELGRDLEPKLQLLRQCVKNEFASFDDAMGKILFASRDQPKARRNEWEEERAAKGKKRAKKPPASGASSAKC